MRPSLALVPALLLTVPAPAGAALRTAADRLDRAAIALGRQAKVSIGISEPALAMVRAKPVADAPDVAAALRQMLAGTGATAVRAGPGSWRIVAKPAPLYRRPPPPPRPVAPPPVQAVTAEVPAVDIVVTASKRDLALGDFPASVSILAMDGPVRGQEGRGSEALTGQVPSVTSTHLGPGRNKLFVRGLADSSFIGTTQATVGEYLGEARLNYNGPDPDLRLYDLRAVEVLEGPQGTLHGVGTLGGVIRFQPNPPDLSRIGASASLGLSLTEHGDPGAEASAVFNLPVAQDLGFRAVGYRLRDGGYIDDRLRGLSNVNRVDIAGGRAWLRFQPDGWTIDLSGAYQRIAGRDSQYADRDGPPLSKSSPIAEGYGSRYALASLTVRKSWDHLTLTSATSVARQRGHESFDASQPNAPRRFDQATQVDFISNENRLTGQGDDGSSWVVGTSLVHNRYSLDRDFSPLRLFAALGGVANKVDEATLFGEATLPLSSTLRATAGGRLTMLELSGAAINAFSFAIARDAANKADRREVALLPSVSLAWRPSSGLLVYGRYQQSFRPGGIVVRNFSVSRYKPDDVKSAEIGLRYGDTASLLSLSASLALTAWRDIQADQIDGDGLPTTVNIGDGRIATLDLKASVKPAAGLSLDLAAVFADSRLTRPATATLAAFGARAADVESSDLPNVARLNAYASLNYGVALGSVDLSASAWARYVGASRLGVGPVLGRRQGDYVDAGLGLRATKGRYALSLTATNLFDEVGNRFALGSPFMLGAEEQLVPLRPRTLRLGFDIAF